MEDSLKTHTGKEATLERILDAAESVFSRAGLSGALVDQIAKDAGVTKQLLYHYFSSKNDIFVAVLNRQTERIVHELTEFDLESDAPEKALRTFLEFAFDQYREDSTLAALAQEGIAYHNENPKPDSNFPDMAPSLTKKIASLIERGVAQGVFRPDIDPSLYGATALLVMAGGFNNAYMLTSMLGFDTTSEKGTEIWRKHAVEFVLNSVIK